jgi:hypothetical protein
MSAQEMISENMFVTKAEKAPAIGISLTLSQYMLVFRSAIC